MKTTMLFLTILLSVAFNSYPFDAQPLEEVLLMILGKVIENYLEVNPFNKEGLPWNKFRF